MKTLSIKNAKKFQKRLDKFNESKNFANKSAILEGIAISKKSFFIGSFVRE